MNNVLSYTLTPASSEVPEGPCNYKQWNSLFTQKEDKKDFTSHGDYMNTGEQNVIYFSLSLFNHPNPYL